MRILVVSDIHGNWPALAAIDEPYDVCLCLGDLVDYGPDPALCVRWAMKHATYAIRGNHVHGAAQSVPVSRRLTLAGKRFLLVHATPRDPLDEYLLKDPKTWAQRVHNVEADVVCV